MRRHHRARVGRAAARRGGGRSRGAGLAAAPYFGAAFHGLFSAGYWAHAALATDGALLVLVAQRVVAACNAHRGALLQLAADSDAKKDIFATQIFKQSALQREIAAAVEELRAEVGV